MELKGKRINFLGDSITEGVGAGEGNSYVDQLVKNEGIIAKNYGVSGTRFADQKYKGEPIDYNSFADRIEIMDKNADIVVVFGGTNDYGHGDAPLGSMSDRTTATFYGATHTICRRLLEKYPESQLVIMTPLHRLREQSILYRKVCDDLFPLGRTIIDEPQNQHCPIYEDSGKGLKRGLLDYVEAIREVAEYYSIPVLDLFKVSGIQPEIDIIREKYMPDGLHPNDAGAAILASKLAAFLKTL